MSSSALTSTLWQFDPQAGKDVRQGQAQNNKFVQTFLSLAKSVARELTEEFGTDTRIVDETASWSPPGLNFEPDHFAIFAIHGKKGVRGALGMRQETGFLRVRFNHSRPRGTFMFDLAKEALSPHLYKPFVENFGYFPKIPPAYDFTLYSFKTIAEQQTGALGQGLREAELQVVERGLISAALKQRVNNPG